MYIHGTFDIFNKEKRIFIYSHFKNDYFTILFRGDGDFGKLGRGGSEGCFMPQPIERLTDVGVIQIECGAQFSLALTKSGEIWTWGKVRKFE